MADQVTAGGIKLGKELGAGGAGGFHDDHAGAGAGGEEAGVAKFEDGLMGGGGRDFQLLGEHPDRGEFLSCREFAGQDGALDGFHQLVGNRQAIKELETEREHEDGCANCNSMNDTVGGVWQAETFLELADLVWGPQVGAWTR